MAYGRLRGTGAGLMVLACLGFAVHGASAQCILANPSFEIAGSSGAVFGGWNQFGAVGTSSEAWHGSAAARARGPDTGGWDVSGFWQAMDCAPGEAFHATGQVLIPATGPLVGANTALVNIEWRDSADNLISYDSFTVADATSPVGAWLGFDVLGGPAPSGTVTARILVGTLQSPQDPVSEAVFDAITFDSTSSPTLDEIQWNDFPAGTTLEFSGRGWRVKGPGYYGPGPNVFTDDPQAVWVDEQGALHLTLAQRDGVWQSTEVALEEALGYGDYIVTTIGDPGSLDPAAVLGLFLWQYGPCWDPAFLWWNPYNEIDIEYSRWNDPGRDPGQFVAQPYDWPGNLSRFTFSADATDTISSAMRWAADRVEYRVWRGGPLQESAAATLAAWTYTGPHIPRPEQPRLHLNLWRLDPSYPASDQEVVIRYFRFVPEGAPTPVPVGGDGHTPSRPFLHLRAATPNPFNPRTTIAFVLQETGPVQLDIYGLDGRRLRTLVDGIREAGEHTVVFDGTDASGRPLASGVYLASLKSTGFRETRKLIVAR